MNRDGYGPAWHWGVLVGVFASLMAACCMLNFAIGAWAFFILAQASVLICIIRIFTEDDDEGYKYTKPRHRRRK